MTGDVTGGVTVPSGKTLSASGASIFSGHTAVTGELTASNVKTVSVVDVSNVKYAANISMVRSIVSASVPDLYYEIGKSEVLIIGDNPTLTRLSTATIAGNWRVRSTQTILRSWGTVNIYTGAFRGATGLEEAQLDSVRNIGSYAFSACTSLHTLSLRGIEYIGQNAFAGCTALVNDSNTIQLGQWVEIDANAFANCSNLTFIEVSPLEDYDTGAIMIASNAFSGCSVLTLSIPTCDATQIRSSANFPFGVPTNANTAIVDSYGRKILYRNSKWRMTDLVSWYDWDNTNKVWVIAEDYSS
ncbi:MAG: leucine-rich repeat domain-containing protein [Bacteroidales bacterium]|nr:leucine-rich repeat domain-containing protein [Bacteroidales bacterium]